MRTWQLIVVGVLIHTVFFYSIFDIYFTSPIVHGMTPHVSPTTPPAKRLMLFSTDGLRADKMFELGDGGKTNIPYLRNIIQTEGAWGVSHTRVPTESRPGHVALIAGFYEDVSAVAKGWKENPVEFDSVFNQSRYTWSWGSPDILPMFAKGATGGHVFTHCYPAHFEDFGGSGHSRLDTWVFDEVKGFFDASKTDPDLWDKLHQDKIIFFLHLLGLDTNGHSKKPYSKDYLDNILLVDQGIRDMVDLIEGYYKQDGKTAYVMSSDHGMTDWGSHGAGHPSETLTPLVAWGAGVRGPIKENSTQNYQDSFSQDWKLGHLRRTDVQQADVAPLMASLVGVNFPVNSVGTLPYDYLNFSDSELAEVMYANARQILEQYQVKMELKKSTTLSFVFRPFRELTAVKLAERHRHIHNLIQHGHFKDAIKDSEDVIEVALRGLNYYQTYDRLFLGTSIFCGFVGWMAYILTLIFEKHSGIVRSKVKMEKQGQPLWRSDEGIMAIYAVIGALIVILLFVQSLPWTNYVYCLIPVVLWMVVTTRLDILVQVYNYTRSMKNRNNFILAVAACLIGLEILVIGFFYREMLSVGLAFIGVLPWLSPQKSTTKKPLLLWSLSCIVLSIFPMLPVVTGKRNTLYVILGCVAVLGGSLLNWSRSEKCKKMNVTHVALFLVQLVMVTIATYFSGFLVTSGLSTWQHAISWLSLGISAIEPLLGSTNLHCRLLTTFLAFVAPFILLSVSYEVLFIVSLCALLYQWLHVECSALETKTRSLDDFDFESPGRLVTEKSRCYLVIGDIQRAFYFVFLILTAFFGTGNIASVNSFDPSSVLCFVSVFSPFVMGALLLFKIMIPFILVTCTLQAIHVITRVPIQGLFLLILLMSDCMALHFFFLVRDYGSWLDIGTSISHYVIVMCMIIFIMLLFGLSHVLTRWNIRSPATPKEKI